MIRQEAKLKEGKTRTFPWPHAVRETVFPTLTQRSLKEEQNQKLITKSIYDNVSPISRETFKNRMSDRQIQFIFTDSYV